MMFGLLNVNKPSGMTSRAVVDRVNRRVRQAKSGHAGTLDPLARGVLLVGVGPATRLLEYVQRQQKRYVATFLLGRRSDTDDVEGKVVEVANARRPSEGELDGALSQFVGEISQRPPDYSAVKVRGRRAYELARQGGRLDLEARSVRIDRIERLSYDYPELCLEIHCGSGTYVRALGRDLAVSLGTSAVLSALVRTAVGDFRLEDACSIEQIDGAELDTLLLPPTRIFAASSWVRLTDNDSRCVLRGERLHRPQHNISGVVAALDPHGRLVAVLAAEGGDWLRPEKVFPRSG